MWSCIALYNTASITGASKIVTTKLVLEQKCPPDAICFLGSLFEKRSMVRGSLAGYVQAIRVTYSGWQHLLFYNKVGALTCIKSSSGIHWKGAVVPAESLE